MVPALEQRRWLRDRFQPPGARRACRPLSCHHPRRMRPGRPPERPKAKGRSVTSRCREPKRRNPFTTRSLPALFLAGSFAAIPLTGCGGSSGGPPAKVEAPPSNGELRDATASNPPSAGARQEGEGGDEDANEVRQ